MRILGIESSSLVASVAVVTDDTVTAEYTVNFKKTHSQTLLPMLDEVAKMIELDLDAIDAIAVSGGPGSFTGLRIGSATGKGLGLALKKPLIHVPTVDGLAYNMWGYAGLVCPIMDARRGQVYTGIYRMKDGMEILKEQCPMDMKELAAQLNEMGERVVFLGDGVPVNKQAIQETMTVPFEFAPAHMNRQRAGAIAALGAIYYSQGKVETAAEHKPDYLRKSQAERERAEREENAVPQVRRMTKEDGAAVAEMEHQLFSDAWSEKSVLETLDQPNSICLIGEKAGRTAGYLLAYTAADEAEIARIAVMKEFQRQGAARALLTELETVCAPDGIRRILLDVRSGNGPARKLYEKAGFKEDGIRQRFYEDPVEDAVLMSRDLPAVPTVNRAEISI